MAKNDKKGQTIKKAETKKALTKDALLSALKSNLGNVSKTCEEVGISRNTYYTYLNDEKFKSEVESIEESNIDFAESKLRELINGVQMFAGQDEGEDIIYRKEPNVTATIFYLKTKGKKRGYVEKTESENNHVLRILDESE